MKVLENIPEIVCPECKSKLREEDAVLQCIGCGKVYQVHDGIPCMLGDESEDMCEEITVQDNIACEYESKRYQDPYAKRYHDWWTDQMLKRVRVDGRILDNGCGIGLLSPKIPSSRIVGIDISKRMLQYAIDRYNQLILGNSQKLPLADNSFDVVFCRSIIHHLPEPELAIKEIHRVLRTGGEVVLVDTNTSLLSALPRIIANRGEHFSKEHRNLSRKRIKRLLEPYFEIENIVFFGYLAYPLLGFPDILQLFRFVPFKPLAERILMSCDNILSHIPLVRTQSWAILAKAVKI